MPAWKRYATMALLAVLVLAAAYVIYTKELHHSTTAGATSPPASAPVPLIGSSTRSGSAKTAVPTTIPGGIAPSSRNPFAG